MGSIAALYTEAVHANLKPLYANWEPGRPIQLGDYGLVKGRSFVHLGNVRDLDIAFSERSDTKPDWKSFSSKGTTEVTLHAKGQSYAKAVLEITFGSENGVFFNAEIAPFSLAIPYTLH